MSDFKPGARIFQTKWQSMDIPRTFHNPAAIRTVDKAHFSRDACSEKSKKVPVLVWDGVETHETVFAKFRQPF
jgi:hypothetical protein